MLYYLEVWGLLLAHPGRLDIVGEDVLPFEGDENVCDPEGRGMIYAVISSSGVPGKVGGSPQQERL